MSISLKPKTNYLLIFGALAVGLATFALLTSDFNRTKNTSAYAAPSVGLLETSGNKLIVHAKSDEPADEAFVYCLTQTSSSDTCAWDNADEFDLETPGDYYVFVKSLASGKISAPKLFTFAPIKPSNVKL